MDEVIFVHNMSQSWKETTPEDLRIDHFGLSFVAICVRGLSFGDFSFGKSQMP